MLTTIHNLSRPKPLWPCIVLLITGNSITILLCQQPCTRVQRWIETWAPIIEATSILLTEKNLKFNLNEIFLVPGRPSNKVEYRISDWPLKLTTSHTVVKCDSNQDSDDKGYPRLYFNMDLTNIKSKQRMTNQPTHKQKQVCVTLSECYRPNHSLKLYPTQISQRSISTIWMLCSSHNLISTLATVYLSQMNATGKIILLQHYCNCHGPILCSCQQSTKILIQNQHEPDP